MGRNVAYIITFISLFAFTLQVLVFPESVNTSAPSKPARLPNKDQPQIYRQVLSKTPVNPKKNGSELVGIFSSSQNADTFIPPIYPSLDSQSQLKRRVSKFNQAIIRFSYYKKQYPASQISDYDSYGMIKLNYSSYLQKYHPQKYQKMSRQNLQYYLGIYNRNVQTINRINRQNILMNIPFKLGLNKFSDISQQQFNRDKTVPNLSGKYARAVRNTQQILRKRYVNRQLKLIQIKQKYKIDDEQIYTPISIIKQFQKQPVNSFNFAINEQVSSNPFQDETQLLNSFVPLNNNVPNRRIAKPSDQPQQQQLPFIQMPQRSPNDIDWSNFSGNVEDQGKCNACYAFSALQAIQISARIANFKYETDYETGPFSVQEIISCGGDGQSQLFGCQGGTVLDTYFYLKIDGVGLQSMYPFQKRSKQQGMQFACQQDKIYSQIYRANKFNLKYFRRIQQNNCNEIKVILKSQAVTASIMTKNLQFYKSGIFTTPNRMQASNGMLDHQVTIVGLVSNYVYYFKNQWGWSWGIQGYGYAVKQVGICLTAVQPVVHKQEN